eukprot:CAMPEP_0119477318 /NCGR_PEP_ID=MMETSP1344-20130328/7506_1 /TAXON_ID=236787 /ORGANISM="Florenciella parvula, Strain CCMP2471" /LENGTH=110 /DNA_ID=CAMNT_0007511281 /DNA_START=179 /DNA_END=512 /DNA_ORIENTATION=-
MTPPCNGGSPAEDPHQAIYHKEKADWNKERIGTAGEAIKLAARLGKLHEPHTRLREEAREHVDEKLGEDGAHEIRDRANIGEYSPDGVDQKVHRPHDRKVVEVLVRFVVV